MKGFAEARSDDYTLVTVSPGAWLGYLRPLWKSSYVLIVLSSPTETNRRQLRNLLSHNPGANVHQAGALLAGAEAIAWEKVEDPGIVIIETISSTIDEPACRWDQAALAAQAASRALEDGSRAGWDCRGVVVGGGQTASALMDAMGAMWLRPVGEASPLCGHGFVVGGEHDGLEVVTKGGLVGPDDALASIVGAMLVLIEPALSEMVMKEMR